MLLDIISVLLYIFLVVIEMCDITGVSLHFGYRRITSVKDNSRSMQYSIWPIVEVSMITS